MPDINKLLEEASDHDPHRVHTRMWPALEALAEEAGWHVPDPMTTRTVTVEMTARWPQDHREKESEVSRSIHEALASDLGVGEDGFIHRVKTTFNL